MVPAPSELSCVRPGEHSKLDSKGGLSGRVGDGFLGAAAPPRRLELMLTFSKPAAIIRTAAKAPTHWPLLDFLRATAALLVVFAHSRVFYFPNIGAADQPSWRMLFYFITGLGDEAVIIFFVLSGFLVGGSLAESIRQGRFDLMRYLIARFTRIYAVYIPALAITEAIFAFGWLFLNDPADGALSGHQALDFGGVSQAICFLSGLQGFSCPAWDQNPPLWSLGFEWALYLFAPAIIPLIMWKASRGFRLAAIALVCAIALTVCHYPGRAAFLFGVWFLGAGAHRVLRGGLVPLQAGLLGSGMIIAGMAARRLGGADELASHAVIAAGAALAIACRPLAAFPLAPRFFNWAAGFSYTLYAIHLPLVFLAVAIFQSLGSPRDNVPAPFAEFAATIAICLVAAFLVSLVTERKTEQIRAAILRLCPRRAAGDAVPGETP